MWYGWLIDEDFWDSNTIFSPNTTFGIAHHIWDSTMLFFSVAMFSVVLALNPGHRSSGESDYVNRTFVGRACWRHRSWTLWQAIFNLLDEGDGWLPSELWFLRRSTAAPRFTRDDATSHHQWPMDGILLTGRLLLEMIYGHELWCNPHPGMHISEGVTAVFGRCQPSFCCLNIFCQQRLETSTHVICHYLLPCVCVCFVIWNVFVMFFRVLNGFFCQLFANLVVIWASLFSHFRTKLHLGTNMHQMENTYDRANDKHHDNDTNMTTSTNVPRQM